MSESLMSDVVVTRQATSTTTIEYRIKVWSSGGCIRIEVWDAWPGAPDKAFLPRDSLVLVFDDARPVAEAILALLDERERA